jgi:hypothetical protein
VQAAKFGDQLSALAALVQVACGTRSHVPGGLPFGNRQGLKLV